MEDLLEFLKAGGSMLIEHREEPHPTIHIVLVNETGFDGEKRREHHLIGVVEAMRARMDILPEHIRIACRKFKARHWKQIAGYSGGPE